jgi:hypothetical protein
MRGKDQHGRIIIGLHCRPRAPRAVRRADP